MVTSAILVGASGGAVSKSSTVTFPSAHLIPLAASITLTPSSGPVNTTVSVGGSGFTASATITITFNGATVATTPSPCTSSATGTFTCSFAVPAVTVGGYTVKATDGTHSATATFTVTSSYSLLTHLNPTANDWNFTFPSVSVGTAPVGVVDDSGKGEIFVANGASNNVTVISIGTTSFHPTPGVVANIPVGTTPRGITYDSVSGTVYVVNLASKSVSVISDVSNTVIATVSLTTCEPYADAFDPTDSEVWVSCPNLGTLDIVSTVSYTLVGSTSVGGTGHCPEGVAYDVTQGTVFAGDACMNLVDVVNAPGRTLITQLASGGMPWGVAYDSGKGQVYVTLSSASAVAVFDAAAPYTSIATVPLTGVGVSDPLWDVYDPDVSGVWISNDNSGASSSVTLVNDTSYGTTNYPIGAGEQGIAYDHTTGTIWFASGSSASVFEAMANLNAPLGLVYDSGKNEIFQVNAYADTVSVFDATNHALVATVPVGDEPLYDAYDPTQGYIFVTNYFGTYGVSVISDATNTVIASINLGASYLFPEAVVFDTTQGDAFVAGTGTGAPIFVIPASTLSVASIIPYTVTWLAYDSGKGELFATTGGNVIVLDAASPWSLLATITFPTGSNPYQLTYDPAQGEVFVTEEAASTVAVISDATNAITHSVGVGNTPWGLAYDSGSGVVFVDNVNGGNVMVVSCSTNLVVAKISVGSPLQIAYASGTSRIWVDMEIPGTLWILSG